jgi:uncharacterized protein YbjT (DUF2867 family)
VDLRLHHHPHHVHRLLRSSGAPLADLRPADTIQVLRRNIALAACGVNPQFAAT